VNRAHTTRIVVSQASALASGNDLKHDSSPLAISDAGVFFGRARGYFQAQGIDVVLRKAWDKGIVLGGASAGSICWFEEGTTDSRPTELTVVKGLGLLKGSHCPHYDREKDRRPLYLKLVASGELKPGYACDNDAGIYFENDSVKRIVATRADAKVYYVSAVGGRAVEKPLDVEMIDP